MAFRCTKLLKIIRSTSVFRHNLIATSISLPEEIKVVKPKQYKTEDNLIFLGDPDNFGSLSRTIKPSPEQLEDEGDIQEERFLQNKPLPSQKLTIKQYADLIKQFVKQKRIKEAMDVLEVRMLKEDRVKPVSYIFNILIGACADVGYTKKAFRLYNDMKRRAVNVTGDTYTCLFNACANSPWPQDGLKNAKHLRALMIEKGIEPNLTNYNAMIKAFGWCGDLPTAFQIVDEMMQKKIQIRVHTFNHLLHACISDKNNGFRHALLVWRKMLKMREKPNIYTFNLMLKCVKDCNLGSKGDIVEMINTILAAMPQVKTNNVQLEFMQKNEILNIGCQEKTLMQSDAVPIVNSEIITPKKDEITSAVIDTEDNVTTHPVNKMVKAKLNNRMVPNLLSRVLNMNKVTGLQEVHTVQDKFAIIGGQEDFLKEMEVYSVKPNVKTFTQMLPLLDNTTEAENKLLEAMKSSDIKADIDFYNMLIKKRCLRLDYDAAIYVKQIIKNESEFRKKRYPQSKKLKLNVNIMTYGVLAMSCKTRESAMELLNEMNEKKLKVNIEILGTLLRQGTANSEIGYVLYIMNVAKKENVVLNEIFLKHLEAFNDKCRERINKEQATTGFVKAFENLSKYYTSWLKDVNIQKVLQPDHPWQQFRQNYPDTFQRDNRVAISQPKKFYKRNRKYIPYVPKIVN
ncbi:unnamed protein product [Arctia plantaginis]|uniref:PROP1-like PPR domain-containing protein n=1 Tax=Arctia plantaginis TaxID=874455 RepID=A0A8S1BPS7_ARCPL|nr:unnamed protein product [Arctia plantaginis]